MEAQLHEILSFLHDRNPQARQVALENLVGHTPKGSPYRQIFFQGVSSGGLNPKDSTVIRDLKLLCRDSAAIAHDAFKALVNLSDSAILAPSLSEPSFLGFLVSYIAHAPSVLADLACMLLSNITAFPVAAKALISLEVPLLPYPASNPPYYPPSSRCSTSMPPYPYPEGNAVQVNALSLLADAFISAAPLIRSGEEEPPKTNESRKGELHFLASVFANVSILPAGRLFLLTPMLAEPLPRAPPSDSDNSVLLEYPLSKLLPFTEHPNTIRRGGVASALKNCAFHTAAHMAILTPDTELITVPPSEIPAPGINALPAILLPLAGPEEFDLDDIEQLPQELQFLPDTKQREPDTVLRLIHIETLLLLCTTRSGRDYLREHAVYPVIKFLHLKETDERVAEHVVRLVNFLKRDEAPDTGDGVDEEAAKGVTANATAAIEEVDEDDDKIVEI